MVYLDRSIGVGPLLVGITEVLLVSYMYASVFTLQGLLLLLLLL